MNDIAKVVVDTCVMVDMLVTSRPRHEAADRLRKCLAHRKIVARIPYFAIFEISHATRQEKRLNNAAFLADEEIPAELVPVDRNFVQKYFNPSLPEMRAGDLVFASMALGDRLILITEDANLAIRAKAAGVDVKSIHEMLSLLEHAV